MRERVDSSQSEQEGSAFSSFFLSLFFCQRLKELTEWITILLFFTCVCVCVYMWEREDTHIHSENWIRNAVSGLFCPLPKKRKRKSSNIPLLRYTYYRYLTTTAAAITFAAAESWSLTRGARRHVSSSVGPIKEIFDLPIRCRVKSSRVKERDRSAAPFKVRMQMAVERRKEEEEKNRESLDSLFSCLFRSSSHTHKRS